MQARRIDYLYQLCIDRQASPAEQEEFFTLLQLPEHESLARQFIRASLQQGATTDMPLNTSGSVLEAIFGAGAPVVPITTHPKRWWHYTAAAVVLLLLAGATWFLWLSPQQPAPQQATVHDRAPGADKAILILDDGATVILDKAAIGAIAEQGSMAVVKEDSGTLRYAMTDPSAAKKDPAKILFNTLTTPRGGQYKLTLPDGTKVWLNAASSIRYPTAFSGRQRKVEVKGEVYFEVAKDVSKPFLVNTNDIIIEVLGTHFNINAYPDEPQLRTTLLEGSVRITRVTGSKAVITLQPAQQAILPISSLSSTANPLQVQTLQTSDLEEVMAWKNGLFLFNNATIESIMRQVARWYDVEIVFEGPIPAGHYRGKVSRDLPVSQLLKVIELSGVHFTIDGNKILVQ